jgi:hypothetical protein
MPKPEDPGAAASQQFAPENPGTSAVTRAHHMILTSVSDVGVKACCGQVPSQLLTSFIHEHIIHQSQHHKELWMHTLFSNRTPINQTAYSGAK